MRISNPPPGGTTSSTITGIKAPNSIVTTTPLSFSSNTPLSFAADPLQFELILSNLDPVAVMFANEGGTGASNQGIAIQPKGTAVINTQAAVTVTTTSASQVTLNATKNRYA